MAQALVLQINETLADSNLEMPILGAFQLDVIRHGTGSGYSHFSIAVVNTPTLLKVANCEIYELTGSTPMTEYTLPVGTTNLRIKSTAAARGRLLIKDTENITTLGTSAYGFFKATDMANSPSCVINLNQLGTKFVTYNGGYDTKVILTGDINRFFTKSSFLAYGNFITAMESRLKGDARTNTSLKQLIQLYCFATTNNSDFKVNIARLGFTSMLNMQFGDLYGSLADIKPTVTLLQVLGAAKDFTTGDIADIPASVTNIQLDNRSDQTYRGVRTWNNLARFVVKKTVFSSAITTLLLKDISAGTINTGALISFIGTVTTEAQGYITTIQSKGGTVSILNP